MLAAAAAKTEITTIISRADKSHGALAPTTQTEVEEIPTLVDGILKGNGAELALLLRVFYHLMRAHHAEAGPKIKNMLQLADLVDQLHGGQIDWIDLDESNIPNPDAKAIRSLLLDVGRTILLRSLAQCISLQRRCITGKPYADITQQGWRIGKHPLADKGSKDPRIRWTQYAPEAEVVVEALFFHVRNHDNLHLAGVVETMDAAKAWQTTILPWMRQHYHSLCLC